MQVNVEQISPVLVEFNVEIDAAVVTTEYEKAFRQVSKSSRIKGFRPGKAPKSIVRRVYGARLQQDVIQRLVDDTFPKAAAEKEMQPINQPKVEANEFKTGAAFGYKATVEVLPKIESVTYEGLEAKRPGTSVEDDKVEAELESIRVANSTLEEVKDARAAKEGDVVTCDLEVEVDGEKIEDAGAQGYPIEIGKGQVFKEVGV